MECVHVRVILILFQFTCIMWNIKNIDGQCAASSTTGKNPDVDSTENLLIGTTFLLQTNDNEYQITCCGFVTQWDIDIATTGTLYAEVWRNVSGNWNLVGVNTITVQASDVDTTKTEVIAAAQQIPVQKGDYIGFKSSGNTIVKYEKLKGGGKGVANLNQVQFSTTSGNSVPTTSAFTTYTTETNIDFGLRATLGPGSTPTFAAGLATTRTLSDDTVVGTTLLTVVATDPGDTVSLTLQSTTPASAAINFNTTTGVLSTVSQLPIGNTVFVFNASDLCENFVEHTFTLTVINYPPVINNLPSSVEVSEDVNVETQLIVLNVTDASLDDTVTCSLTSVTPTLTALYLRYAAGTSNYAFGLRAGAGLDYDTVKTYSANINCTDTKNTTSGIFIIYVLRNQPPVITNLPSTNNSVDIASSGTSIGTTVFTVTSTDRENDQLFYNMTCTPVTCPFKIYNSGAILVDKSLAGLSDSTYDMYIYVYDGHTLVGPRSLTVKFTDVNTPPVVTNLPTTVQVPENTAAFTTIFTVTKSDVNSLDTHTWTSTISPTSGALYFTIDSSTGAINTSSINIDFETIGTTTFLLTAYVSDGQASASGTVTVSIINQNEAPMFLLSSYTITGNESSAGSSIGTPSFLVSDPDAGAAQTYSQNCPQLTLDPTTKLVTFSTDYDVDTGNPTSLTCTVTVSDGQLTDTATLNVNINNLNDNTPTFTASSYSFYAFSTADVGTVIASFPATDGDIGTFGEITYTINQTSTGGAYFGISHAGELLVTSSLGGFSSGTNLSVTITATDGGGLTDSATITLVIAAVTTTTVSTTTDRYMTFFEDTRNVAWFVPCMMLWVGLLMFITYLVVRFTDFQNLKRWCQKMCRRKRRWKPKRTVIPREPTAVSSFTTSGDAQTWSAWKITDTWTPN